jgi:hypothetical protein
MKKALMIAAAIIFAAGSASAVLPPVGYIGIFKDMTHDTDPAANYVCPSLYGQFTAVIWCLPSINGLKAAEFAVSHPATIVSLAWEKNPLLGVELGVPTEGISVSLISCQLEWTWLYQITMLSLAATTIPQKVEIVPHPGTLPLPVYQFANCQTGHPIEPCIYLTPLYVCWTPSPLGVEEASWGAIKRLF